MKRLLLSAVLGVAALGLSATAVQAGPFSCNSGCGKCGANFCVRQYNAFTPACFGTVHCDGINPLSGPCIPGGGYCPQPCGGCCMPGYFPPPAEMMHGPMPYPGMMPPLGGMPMQMPQPGGMQMMPPPGGAPMQLPPPGALPMPSPGAVSMMGYPYYIPQMINPALMPAAYGYPPYGNQADPNNGAQQQAAPAAYPQQ